MIARQTKMKKKIVGGAGQRGRHPKTKKNNMREEESSSEAEWLEALIISLSINLLTLWDPYHQKMYCPFLCPYPLAPHHTPPPHASAPSQVAHQTRVQSGSRF